MGCIDCKQPVIDGILAEQQPMRERAQRYEANPGLVRDILMHGSQRAQEVARGTMQDVRQAAGLMP